MTSLAVVIPVFDDVAALRRAVSSVIRVDAAAQVIIVDDGSASEAAAEIDLVAARWAGDDVRAVHLPHGGPSAARNGGLRLVTADYVIFLDCDDELVDGAGGAIAGTVRDHEVGVLCGAVRVLSDAGQKVVSPAVRPGVPDARLSELAGSFVVSADIARVVGGYDEAMRYGENTDFVLRVADQCRRQSARIVSTDEVMMVYHERMERRRYDRERLDSAVHLLRRGRFDLDVPGERAKVQAIAAVNAARVGDYATSIRFAVMALRTEPRNIRHLARAALAFTGPLARRRWTQT